MIPALAWTARLLAFVACGLSAYLWYASATASPVVGCGWSEFDCDAALGSRWSKWFGVPVAAGGLACYAAAFAGTLIAGRAGGQGTLGWRLLEGTTALAVGSALWFFGVQAAALGSFCLYCMATHACGVALAAVVVAWRWQASQASDDGAAALSLTLSGSTAAADRGGLLRGPPTLGVPTLAGLMGVAALAGGQLLSEAPATVAEYEVELGEAIDLGSAPPTSEAEAVNSDSPSEAAVAVTAAKTPISGEPASLKPAPRTAPLRKAGGSRTLSLLNGSLRIDAYRQPILGSPEAPHVIVELMDYACPHCREFHDKLHEALELFDGRVAVVVLPVPGEITCNPYTTKSRKVSAGACFAAKLSLAVASLDPMRFESFHEWMLEDDRIPSRTSSLIAARERVAADDLSLALQDNDGRFARQVRQNVELAYALRKRGRFGLPSQIIGDTIQVGPPETVEQLCELWSRRLGLPNPAPTNDGDSDDETNGDSAGADQTASL